jgi:cytochrome c553
MSRLYIVVLTLLGTIFLFLYPKFIVLNSAANDNLVIQAQSTPDAKLSVRDDVCLECHGQPGLTLELENGEMLELFVNPADHQNSIHGRLGYACVQCHRTVGNYPHPPFSALDQRDASLQLYEVCKECHISEYNLHDSVA